MLILTRRIGESIMIGDDIVVTVLGVQGNQVKIGIDAPKNVRVDREEIYRKIQAEKLNASNNPGNSKADAPPSGNYNSYAPAKTAPRSSYTPAVVAGTDYDNDQYMVPKSPKSQPEIIVKKKRVLTGSET